MNIFKKLYDRVLPAPVDTTLEDQAMHKMMCLLSRATDSRDSIACVLADQLNQDEMTSAKDRRMLEEAMANVRIFLTNLRGEDPCGCGQKPRGSFHALEDSVGRKIDTDVYLFKDGSLLRFHGKAWEFEEPSASPPISVDQPCCRAAC